MYVGYTSYTGNLYIGFYDGIIYTHTFNKEGFVGVIAGQVFINKLSTFSRRISCVEDGDFTSTILKPLTNVLQRRHSTLPVRGEGRGEI